MAHDPRVASARAAGCAPLYESWAVFFLVTAPHWAALGAAVGYYTPGRSVLTVTQPTHGVPVREFGIEDEVGGALLYLFPLLAAAVSLVSFTRCILALQPPFFWPWCRHYTLVLARSPHPAVLAVSGWGSLGFCVLLELSGGGAGDIVSDVMSSPLGWGGSREGRGLIGLVVGLLAGFVLTGVGLCLDRRAAGHVKG